MIEWINVITFDTSLVFDTSNYDTYTKVWIIKQDDLKTTHVLFVGNT